MDFLTDNNNIVLETVLPLLGGLNKMASEDGVTEDNIVERTKHVLSQDCAAYPSVLFAKQASRQYPISNRLETILSYAYAAHSSHGDRKLVPTLRKVASRCGIGDLTELVDNLFAPLDNLAKTASTSEDGTYALVVGEHKNYPCRSRVEISESAVKLSRDLDRMPVLHSRIAARGLTKRANEIGLSVDQTVFPASILKRAEQRLPVKDGADLVLKQRESFYSEKALKVLDGILTKVASTPLSKLDEAEIMVAQIEKMDAAAGLTYGRVSRISDPYATIFRGPTVEMIKQASEQMVRVPCAEKDSLILHVSRVQDAAMSAPPAEFLSGETGEFLQKIASADTAAEVNVLIESAPASALSDLSRLLGARD